jgi:hypothetical protein
MEGESGHMNGKRRGRPESGRGGKVGIYLSVERCAHLGVRLSPTGKVIEGDPVGKIYDLIDGSPCNDDSVTVTLRLTADELAAMGAKDEEAAKTVLMKTVSALAASKKRGR